MMRQTILVLMFIISAGFLTNVFVVTPTTHAANCETGFLGFPTWYRGVSSGANCDIKLSQSDAKGNTISKFIWTIVLNVIEIALRLVGIISVFFIIYGGFLFLARGSESDKIAEAKLMIRNAVIGLVLSIFSVALVSFVVTRVFA